jgi:hypothetical protein
MRKCVFCGRDVSEEASVCEACQRDLPAETIALGMPLCYEHMCKECGARTMVSDTRYWQTIGCPECGEPFLANPPMSTEF